MTTFGTSFASPLYGRSSFDQMSESDSSHWRQDYYAQAPMLTQQWPNPHGPHLSGRQSLDISMYADEPYSHVRFFPTENWPDMDVGTSSSASFRNESPDLAIPALPIPTGHLQIPGSSRPHSNPTHSPNSSQGGMSPSQSPMPMPYGAELMPPQERRVAGSSTSSLSKARLASDEDGDYEPNEDPRRGKKRQRIPHTAVEKRYRENLNAHLDKLRQTVPTLAARAGAGKGLDRGDGAKPSKCEILNGAIDHIGSLDRENFALRNEVRALRSKIDDMDSWYRSNSH